MSKAREPADREDQVGRAGVVTQKRNDPDEQRQHRQHHRRRAGLLFRDRVTRAEPEEAGQHREILVEGIDRKDRCQPADHHEFQQQAEHRHQNDQPDLRLGIQGRRSRPRSLRPSARPGAPATRRSSPSGAGRRPQPARAQSGARRSASSARGGAFGLEQAVRPRWSRRRPAARSATGKRCEPGCDWDYGQNSS